MAPARVAVDTSALMMPVEADVRLFDELRRLLGAFEAVVPEPVEIELATLKTSGGEEGKAAAVGYELLDRCTVVETKATYADDAIVELTEQSVVDYAATNDRDLRERVLAAGVPVISLRASEKLAVTQP